MSDPHNKQRYGELNDPVRLSYYLTELEFLKAKVILSGGWAWHFMSPKGHAELKHAHDHKDVDIFVSPQNIVDVITILTSRGFKKIKTRLPAGKDDFRRYEKIVEDKKLVIDFFVGDDFPTVEIDGWTVVEPKCLLSFYSNICSSNNCFAVIQCAKIIAKGENPVGRKELIEISNK